LVNGIWGTLAVGIFGGGNILIQALGIVSIGGFTVLLSTIFWFAIKATIGLRVHPEQEYEGLDIAEHGMEAYNGFVKEAPSVFSGSTAMSSSMKNKGDFH
jgi:Amt family ammonium transporter